VQLVPASYEAPGPPGDVITPSLADDNLPPQPAHRTSRRTSPYTVDANKRFYVFLFMSPFTSTSFFASFCKRFFTFKNLANQHENIENSNDKHFLRMATKET